MSVVEGPQGLTARLESAAGRVRQTREYAAWLFQHSEAELAADLGGCASWLLFHHFVTAPGSPVKLADARTCKKPLHCAFCAAGRATKAAQKATPKVLGRLREAPGLIPYLLTITQRTGPDLRERVKHLFKSWTRALQRRTNCSKGQAPSSFAHLDGGIMCFETKRGQGSNEWHVHGHGVVLAPPGLSKFQFVDEWAWLLGQETANLDLRPLKSAGVLATAAPSDLVDLVAVELLEVFKYAVKVGDMNHADHLHAAKTLRRARLCRGFGSMLGFEPPEDLLDDLSQFDGMPYDELFFKLTGGRYVPGDWTQEPGMVAFKKWAHGAA